MPVNTARSDLPATLRSMDRDAEIRKAQGGRLGQARLEAGYRSAREAALENDWPESSYRAHENGSRTIGRDDAEKYAKRFGNISAQQILFGEQDPDSQPPARPTVPIMGFIGAGAEIDPDFEQVPESGLYDVELPFPLPEDLIGFEVRGDSMLPRYNDGDVIVVTREQTRRTESFIGEEAAVRVAKGQRYIKRIAPGPKPRTFNLESFNALTIAGAKIAWVGEIRLTLPRGQTRKLEHALAREIGSGSNDSVLRRALRR
jgi:phage repressor protein C with HTH and peptisase S24 domain